MTKPTKHDDLLLEIKGLRYSWKNAQISHGLIYESTDRKDKKSLHYSEILGAIIHELDQVIKSHEN